MCSGLAHWRCTLTPCCRSSPRYAVLGQRRGQDSPKTHGAVQINSSLAEGLALVAAPDFQEWQLDVRVLDANPIYAGQTFRLRFRFSARYPIEPPEVMFVAVREPPRPIPLHPHIYSNGIICLDLLDKAGWSPVQNVETVCMSLQSMLTGNTLAERPPGDDAFVRSNVQSPRNIRWDFHDDHV
jgi:ubiquitin-conjugating enzyme E2 W